MNRFIFKSLKALTIILYVIAAIIIAVYPFQNRDLTLLVETDQTTYELNLPGDEINAGKRITLELPNANGLILKKVKVYGAIKTICVKVINDTQFFNYISSSQDGTAEWADGGILLSSISPSVRLDMNEEGKQALRKVSKSYLLERFLLMEIALIGCMLLFAIVTVVQEKHDPTSRNNHSILYEIRRFFKDIKTYQNYMIYAAKTDLKAEVANSYLNRLWWLLEPLFNMLVYVVVFGGMMGNSIQNYATFVYSALLMWNFFSKTINYSVKLVRNNKDIITKVYVPKFVLLISNMFLNLFKMLFSMIVLAIMLIVFRVQIKLEVFMVIPAYIDMILLSFGLGMIFLHYGVYVDDLSYAVSILLSMLMFLSGIFYEVITTLGEPLNIMILAANPVAMVVDTMRNALLYGRITNVPLIVIWFFISILLCCIGVHMVYKNENGYVKVV